VVEGNKSNTNGRIIINEEMIRRALVRISHEIVEENGGTDNLVIVGIRTRGVALARRLVEIVESFEGVKIPMGIVDITLYRDDIHHTAPRPVVGETDLTIDINGKVVVLVDDVLFTGRTIRAAMDELIDFGRPSRILLAVLVDRGHRELPIRPDFVGKNIPTSRGETVVVRVKEVDELDEVSIGAK
jgi:pyrimidine operon attenuation protein/uracil phosphoribosyltransferase